MAFDFPSSPAVGDVYSSGGVSYRWDGQAWVGGPMIDAGLFVKKAGDTMTGPLVLYGDPAAALEAVPKRYADAEANANLFSNPCFLSSGKAAFAAQTGAAQDTAECLRVVFAGGPTLGSVIANNLTLQSAYPLRRGPTYLLVTSSLPKGAGAADYGAINMAVEQSDTGGSLRWGSNVDANASRSLIFRALVRTTQAGRYYFRIYNLKSSPVIGFIWPVDLPANTDVVVTKTIPAPVNTSAWADGLGAQVVLYAGTNYQVAPPGAAGAWVGPNVLCGSDQGVFGNPTTGQQFLMQDVGLYADYDANGIVPPFHVPSIAESIQAGKRYFQKLYITHRFLAVAGEIQTVPVHFPVAMRAIPTFTVDTNGTQTNVNAFGTTTWFHNTTPDSGAWRTAAAAAGNCSLDGTVVNAEASLF